MVTGKDDATRGGDEQRCCCKGWCKTEQLQVRQRRHDKDKVAYGGRGGILEANNQDLAVPQRKEQLEWVVTLGMLRCR